MEMLKYFFEAYFNQTFGFDYLERLIQDFKKSEHESYQLQLITELQQIIQSKSYALAAKLMKKYAQKTLNLDLTEKFINFIYNKLTDQPAHLDMNDFIKDCKVVFCPVCCPTPNDISSMIQKATIIANNQQIYICRPCKLMWLDENNIRSNNAQAYKTFMKSLGLKGTWKELTNIDVL